MKNNSQQRIRFYQVDAFSKGPFTGNPAAVCLLEAWPEDSVLQRIATENNLSETAFVVRQPDGFGLRWFTPAVEVDLCGSCHAGCGQRAAQSTSARSGAFFHPQRRAGRHIA